VTPGILPVGRARAAKASGLCRSNLSVHGFTRVAFAARGNPPRRYAAWRSHFDFWSRAGASPKLNYVYGGPRSHADLAALLAFAREHRAMVRLLDDLSGPPVSVDELRAVLLDISGPEFRSTRHQGPHSLPTERLEWSDGATVELKATRLGELSPLSACAGCARRAACREGIHAWRLTADGRLKPCALRDDLGIPIVEVLRTAGVDGAVEAWSALARRMTP
jgi:molybdenum cofactor biosynthesis enzyme MoaA